MSDELDQSAVDAAIILENRVNERIREAVQHEIRAVVTAQVNQMFNQCKTSMLMEITTSINEMLRGFIEQERKPLWEFKPEEFKGISDDIR